MSLTLFLLLFLAGSRAARPSPSSRGLLPPGRPTVGLVLEGGGALGLAHAGVLRWLEEHRIPIDCISGTSIGAAVGGCYATGMSAPEIQKLLQTFPWDKALRDETPYADLVFRRKNDRRMYPNSLEFGLRRGLIFRSGLSSGQRAGMILDRAALPYFDLRSFDQLPTPFRCVATDLTAGRAHVFDRGPLSQALRSTMAIPGVLPPVAINVEVNGRCYTELHVDGGVTASLFLEPAMLGLE